MNAASSIAVVICGHLIQSEESGGGEAVLMEPTTTTTTGEQLTSTPTSSDHHHHHHHTQHQCRHHHIARRMNSGCCCCCCSQAEAESATDCRDGEQLHDRCAAASQLLQLHGQLRRYAFISCRYSVLYLLDNLGFHCC